MFYDKNNIFAKIILGDIPCKKIYEDDSVLAFEDVSPAAPTHILVIPKGEYVSFDDFCKKAGDVEVSNFFKVVQKVASQCGVSGSGYRVRMNHGDDASQTVHHFHAHILGGRNLGGLVQGDIHNR